MDESYDDPFKRPGEGGLSSPSSTQSKSVKTKRSEAKSITIYVVGAIALAFAVYGVFATSSLRRTAEDCSAFQRTAEHYATFASLLRPPPTNATLEQSTGHLLAARAVSSSPALVERLLFIQMVSPPQLKVSSTDLYEYVRSLDAVDSAAIDVWEQLYSRFLDDVQAVSPC